LNTFWRSLRENPHTRAGEEKEVKKHWSFNCVVEEEEEEEQEEEDGDDCGNKVSSKVEKL